MVALSVLEVGPIVPLQDRLQPVGSHLLLHFRGFRLTIHRQGLLSQQKLLLILCFERIGLSKLLLRQMGSADLCNSLLDQFVEKGVRFLHQILGSIALVLRTSFLHPMVDPHCLRPFGLRHVWILERMWLRWGTRCRCSKSCLLSVLLLCLGSGGN